MHRSKVLSGAPERTFNAYLLVLEIKITKNEFDVVSSY